jgi:glutathione S-transferase
VRLRSTDNFADVQAPACTGNPIFERYFRVHQNTMEQLVIFLPSLYMFSSFVSGRIGALIGSVFVVGRVIYGRGYVQDPKSRELGALLSFLPSTVLLLGSLGAAAYSLTTGKPVPKFL